MWQIKCSTAGSHIQCCEEEIRETILTRVRAAKYYSVIFDETTDISTSSKMSLVVSYIYKNRRYEDFLDFLNVHEECCDSSESFEPKISGVMLGRLVVQKLRSYKLIVLHCIGIGTDGCSLMSEQVGAIQEIKKVALNAFYCPCFNHAVNLTIHLQ